MSILKGERMGLPIDIIIRVDAKKENDSGEYIFQCKALGELVRCEKCRHGIKAHGISDGWVLCTKPYVTDTVGNMMHRCDWFCADGERKEKNA